MKIDAINFGAFSTPAPVQNLKAEETNSSLDEYDETRIATNPVKENRVDECYRVLKKNLKNKRRGK